MFTVFGAAIASRAITNVPIVVSIVAVYRFDGSIPISGGWENRCTLGAEPSRGGKLFGIATNLSASHDDRI